MGIELITISRPSAYVEYEPYRFIKTKAEFEEAVAHMAEHFAADKKK